MNTKRKIVFNSILLLLLVLSTGLKAMPVQAVAQEKPKTLVSAWEIISAMNTWRMSNGLPALIEDGTINAVAQSTAQTMADQNLSWHIGNVGGRLQAAGYGGGQTVFATENFAMGTNLSIDQIMVMWSDADHMRPVTNPNYCHVGAGVATASNGFTYYILQAAYISGQACTGSYTPPGGGSGTGTGQPFVPGGITPVEIAEMDENGIYTHLVKPGQSLWLIAIAYEVRIADIRKWNNLSESYKIRIGDELIILSPKAKGYVPPPKEGQVEVSKPGPDGKVVHTVRPYEYLGKIAEAYGVTVARIAELNGIKVTTPLTIGWELVIVPSNHTATPTERPLSPIERLTPAADGKYYHIVGEGAALEGIAKLYGISVKDLMAWNNLNENSIIYVGDRLLLNITPPPTITPTFTPVTPSPTATITLTPSNTPIPSATPTQTLTDTSEARRVSSTNITKILLPVFAGIAVVAAIILFLQYRKKHQEKE